MNKTEFIAVIAKDLGLTKEAAKKFYNGVGETIAKTLREGHDVLIPEVGTLKVKDTPERTVRNPSSGATITVPAGRKVALHVTASLKASM